MNLNRALQYLASAVANAVKACERTRRLVAAALARVEALLCIQRAAA